MNICQLVSFRKKSLACALGQTMAWEIHRFSSLPWRKKCLPWFPGLLQTCFSWHSLWMCLAVSMRSSRQSYLIVMVPKTLSGRRHIQIPLVTFSIWWGCFHMPGIEGKCFLAHEYTTNIKKYWIRQNIPPWPNTYRFHYEVARSMSIKTKILVSLVTQKASSRPSESMSSLFAWSNVHKHLCRVPGWAYTHHKLSS